jgi:CheY-like chemotaxis protein
MPELLLLSNDTKSYFELQELAERKNFRTKATVDIGIAKEWAGLRAFDVVLVASGFEHTQVQEMASKVWRSNPRAAFVIFSSDSPSNTQGIAEQVFLGAELAIGPDYEAQIERIIDDVQGQLSRISPNQTKILVVEDLDSPRDIICFFVENLGLGTVKGVSSARKALAEIEADPKAYTCIITDIKMPKMSGKELIDVVRLHPKLQHIPIIVLTAYGTVDTLIDCLKAGASGFLVKPPKKEDLLRELGRAIRISERGASPRLAAEFEAEQLRELLLSKGFS